MRKIVYCVVLLFIAGVTCTQQDEDYSIPNWESDYDNLYDYDFLKEESKNLETILKSNENIPVNNEDADKKVEEEIQKLREAIENDNSAKEIFDVNDDYQIEDSKQNSQEETLKEAVDSDGFEDDTAKSDKSNEMNDKDTELLESVEENAGKENKTSDSKEFDRNADYALLWGDDVTTAHLPVPIVEDDKAIFQETQEILSEDNKDDNTFDEEKQDISLPVEEQTSIEQIIDETKKILFDNDNSFENEVASDENDKNVQTSEETNNDNAAQNSSSEKNMAKDENDTDEELQKLFEVLNNLSKGEYDPKDKAVEEAENTFNVLDYELKNGKPYNEDLVLSQRDDQSQDYELINDSNLSEIFAKAEESSNEASEDKSEEIDKDVSSNLKLTETRSPKKLAEDTTIKPIMYENDALVDDKQRVDSAEVEEFDVDKNESNSEEAGTNREIVSKDKSSELIVRKKMVDDLSSSELDDLMEQFTIYHSEDLDVHSSDFLKDVAPIHIKLSVDEPVVITSPNYPNPYPTNNIIDWVFDGEGMGIELNVTDFAVNGALGDYVLFKPGGIDETGHDGLVFSYRLTSERRFRFTDVNRMFVRFQANLGMMFLRGFKFSVKLISPLPEDPEDQPEPEAVLTPPSETLTVHLGGVSLHQFQDMKEDFRELIADMAAHYIRDNKIDPGMNFTNDITQITSTSLCNVNWPDHENCAGVTFGVPLTYEEGTEYRLTQDDLEKMWRKYIVKDPFALRLRRMGITEFAMPDDSSVMMVWLVIAVGVVISMAMLAFALWRFSCFEDYTRMQAYSDTDSVKNEKRGLDLYPTPHQILPPLYAENDYKWADDTRVDMGGFANKNYVRDDLYDFDSEEEVAPSRDRFTTDV